MYFITNKEGFVIAASSKFISKLGSRDICSLSSILNDKLINFKEENNLSINGFDNSFRYTKSTLHSAFGELELYNLQENDIQTNIDDENIEYLKKIKEGAIVKEDNEYSIPDIPILKHEKETDNEKDNILKEIEDIEVTNITIKSDLNKIDEVDIKDKNDSYKESIAKIYPNSSTIEIKEDTHSEKIEEIHNTESEKLDTNSKELELKIPEIPKEAIEESYQTVKIETKDQKEEKTSLVIKEYVSDQIDNNDNNKEDNLSDIKITKKSIVDSEESELNSEKKKKGLFNRNIFSWGKKRETKESNNNEIESIIENSAENKKQNEENKTLDNSTIKSQPTNNIDVSINKDLSTKEDNLNESKEAISNIVDNKPLDEKENEERNLNFISIQKEAIKNIEEREEKVVESEKLIEKDSSVLFKDKEERTTDSIVEKIALKQIESLNLIENANKLNIEINSYKMLLNSYLGEIDKYMPKLVENDEQTIEMLIDAGQLLSLDSIVSKLTALKDNILDDKNHYIKEIKYFATILKEKLNEQPVDNETTAPDRDNNLQIKDIIQETTLNNLEESTKPKIIKIEDSYGNNLNISETEIISAEQLLETIEAELIDANPKIASEELNLPESLILEFMHDFLAQSKEHLPIMIEAYLEKNLQQIQNTAHMLKGAANNLRLNKIADNLFRIQKENILEKDVELIQKFVAQIKGLEISLKKLGD